MYSAAVAASIVENLVTYPLESWKVRSQLRSSAASLSTGPRPIAYTGVSPFLVGNIVRTFVRCSVYSKLGPEQKSNAIGGVYSAPALVAGLCAATAETLVIVPFETVKTRMILAANTHSAMSATQLCRHIYRNEGLSGFTKGTAATFARQISSSGLRFPLYYFQSSSFLVLAVTSVAECFVSQPLDSWKTRKQSGLDLGKPKLRSMFAGLLPRAIRRCMGTLIVFYVYNRVSESEKQHELQRSEKMHKTELHSTVANDN